MKEEISPIILEAVKIMRTCFGGVDIEIIDDEMSRKFPSHDNPHGLLGITILIEDTNVFLTYQIAEDISVYGIHIAESFVYNFISIEKTINDFRKIKIDETLNGKEISI